MARVHAELHPRAPQSGKLRRVRGGDQYRHYWLVHLVRYVARARSISAIPAPPPSLPCPAGIPIALRVIHRARFERGPFHLGPFSYPIAIIACLWILFISIVFILPQANPVDSQTLNYAVVAVGIVVFYSLGFWFLSARRWFTGPVKQIAAEEMGIDVMDPANADRVDGADSEKS